MDRSSSSDSDSSDTTDVDDDDNDADADANDNDDDDEPELVLVDYRPGTAAAPLPHYAVPNSVAGKRNQWRTMEQLRRDYGAAVAEAAVRKLAQSNHIDVRAAPPPTRHRVHAAAPAPSSSSSSSSSGSRSSSSSSSVGAAKGSQPAPQTGHKRRADDRPSAIAIAPTKPKDRKLATAASPQ